MLDSRPASVTQADGVTWIVGRLSARVRSAALRLEPTPLWIDEAGLPPGNGIDETKAMVPAPRRHTARIRSRGILSACDVSGNAGPIRARVAQCVRIDGDGSGGWWAQDRIPSCCARFRLLFVEGH